MSPLLADGFAPCVAETENPIGLLDTLDLNHTLDAAEGCADLETLIEMAHDTAALHSLGIDVMDEVPGSERVIHERLVAGHLRDRRRFSLRINHERIESLESGVDPTQSHRLVAAGEPGQDGQIVPGAFEGFTHDGLTLHDEAGYR